MPTINKNQLIRFKKPFIVALIPAYNEEATIASIIIKTQKHVDVVIVCDDGSTDMTREIAKRLGAIVLIHERNLGKGAALKSLFQKARELHADIAITLDADGQHDPNEIPKLVEKLIRTDADIVIGSRFLKQPSKIPSHKIIGNKLLNLIINAGVTDTQSGFRAYSKRAISLITPSEMGMGVDSEILIKAKEKNLKIVEVDITANYSVPRPSKLHPIRHRFEVILTVLKYKSMQHILLFYGIPGILALLVGGLLWLQALQILATHERLMINIILMAIGTTIAGSILMTTAIALWVLMSIVREKAG